MTKKCVHDLGIEHRIKQIIASEPGIIAVARNLDYSKKENGKILVGELDILKLYSDGTIGIEEIKSSYKGLRKAQEQLMRAKHIFKNYDPVLWAYVVQGRRLIKY